MYGSLRPMSWNLFITYTIMLARFFFSGGGGAGGWKGEIYILSQVRRVTDLHTLATSSLCLCGILFWISRLLLWHTLISLSGELLQFKELWIKRFRISIEDNQIFWQDTWIVVTEFLHRTVLYIRICRRLLCSDKEISNPASNCFLQSPECTILLIDISYGHC